jgi:hypothetical protein
MSVPSRSKIRARTAGKFWVAIGISKYSKALRKKQKRDETGFEAEVNFEVEATSLLQLARAFFAFHRSSLAGECEHRGDVPGCAGHAVSCLRFAGRRTRATAGAYQSGDVLHRIRNRVRDRTGIFSLA